MGGNLNFHRGKWRRRVLITLGIVGGLFLIFHRPLLQGLGDYGWNPDQQPGEDVGAFHFSFGFAF